MPRREKIDHPLVKVFYLVWRYCILRVLMSHILKISLFTKVKESDALLVQNFPGINVV